MSRSAELQLRAVLDQVSKEPGTSAEVAKAMGISTPSAYSYLMALVARSQVKVLELRSAHGKKGGQPAKVYGVDDGRAAPSPAKVATAFQAPGSTRARDNGPTRGPTRNHKGYTAQIRELLKAGPKSAAELATALGISERRAQSLAQQLCDITGGARRCDDDINKFEIYRAPVRTEESDSRIAGRRVIRGYRWASVGNWRGVGGE